MKQKLKYWLLLPLCGALLWFGLATYQTSARLVDDARVLHILNRLSFGATAEQIDRVKQSGIEAYIKAQLSPESISNSPKLEKHLAKLDKLNTSTSELYKKYVLNKQKRESLSPQKIKQINKERRKVYQQAVEANLARAIASPRQLQEVMTNFWFNHFNVFAQKNFSDLLVGNYENQIRNYALGNFRDLLGVTAKHPAMLLYLDNHLNTAPKSPGARGNAKGLNENYARELLELHTLGVDGGYTQADIIALARMLTGWGIDRQGNRGDENGFFFYKNRHDFEDKVFLGTTIEGKGEEEVEQALDMLAVHPATARFISYKLAQYFVADEPPNSLVEKLASTFQETEGDIKSVLDTLFHSPEFNDPKYYHQKFKTPQQYILSLVRAAEIANPNYNRLRGMLDRLAMPIFLCPTPDGYENTRSPWLNPEAMLTRISLATAIANGTLDKEDPVDITKIEASLGSNLSAQTKEAVNKTPPRLRAALLLGSPEMMYR
ncbi:MAG: DUF1800 domain-containing protein [Xenococcaceae cyanobacterium MO_188.B32]|nr:DUF1800 domain-containing protein [Xenococcaceae cyanobacterium MO_188.B32]